ncbi:hypothetical protein Q9L58_007950 [Maublancomyces gigas]|uniref:Flavin-containing monooxygenase n=1 Tax=Discina gigas TaxID=1032678 RepID=A0ABR3GB46_9PEZI
MAPPVDVNTASTEAHPNVWVPVRDEGLFNPKKMRIITVGAGHAGLMMAYKMRHEVKCESYVDHVIYEKNHDVGGTWLENRYPGIACDVPAHIYTFSWEPNPNWTEYYVGGDEIWHYIKDTSDKYDLARDVQFKSKVLEAIWNEPRGKWEIKIDQNGTIISDECDVFIDCSGALNKWNWPKIEGIENFKGHLVHSAKWDSGYDYTDKRVAVIGNGSSAIQIFPKLQKVAAHITNYMRGPTWISSGFSEELTPEGKNFKYTEEQKAEFRDNPASLKKYRKDIEHAFNRFFYALITDSPENKYMTEEYAKIMKRRLGGDEELAQEFIPKWSVGCRRLTPGEGYLEALQEKNASHTWSPIVKITENGIITKDGKECELDAIVCATGFDVSYVPQWKMQGYGGKTLESWREDPQSFLGIHAPDMPNYFIVNGPNCPIGHGSLLAVMEWTSEYILKWVVKLATEEIKSFAVKPDVLNEYNVYIQEFLKRTVWTSGCRSWYKSGTIDGKVTAMYPGSIIHYKELVENIRGEDFDYKYNGPNRFRFMGNGKALLELEGGHGDLSFYIKK